MFNKTDTAQSGNAQNPASLLASSKVNENKREISNQPDIIIADDNCRNYIVRYLEKFKLNVREVIFAITVGTLPVLGIAFMAYSFSSKSISQQIVRTQEAEATSLSDSINRFISSKYGDIQIISNLPFLTNQEVSKISGFSEKQAILNRFVDTYKIYDHLAVFDLNGRVMIQSRGGTSGQEKSRKYFREVLHNNAVVISQPETLKNNKVVIYIASPVKDIITGKTIAVARTRIPIDLLVAEIKNYFPNSDDYYLLDDSGKFIFSPKQDLLGQEATVIYPGLSKLLNKRNGGEFTQVQTINQPLQLVSYVPFKQIEGLPDLNWQLILAKDAVIALYPQRQFLISTAQITAITALLMTLLVAGLMKVLTKQNNSESARIETLANEDTNIPLSEQKDEELPPVLKEWDIQAHQESTFEQQWQEKDTLRLQLLKLVNQIESAAEGDLTVHADVIDGEVGNIANIFNSIVENLRNIVIQVKRTTGHVNTYLDSSQDYFNDLAQEAITQVENINCSLTRIEQMTNSMQVLAASAQKVSVIAHHAHQTAAQSEKAMDLTVQNILSLQETAGETAKKVRYLGESSQQISRVVSLINQIAMQTNLLAINAGIEAALAGEEGQGFAVVAEEVGELAARSAAATQEIEQIVEKIKRDTNEVVQAMEVGNNQVVESTQIITDAKQNLNYILDISQQIDTLLHSITTASSSQLETSQFISKSMQNIATISQLTKNSSLRISESLQETAAISQQLKNNVETFKVN
ncbi:methyl-accepting chemotaxis protein [Trichormus azollae]|uniref:methyl-accepting chemotaxis protein n=1 Tax=Trichormus azollae TaxID=1164 RepID=UPI00325E5FF3